MSLWRKRAAIENQPELKCWCYECNKDVYLDVNSALFPQGIPYVATRMILCPKCGNKRCPHASDHSYACTNSNEPGQPGSRYP